MADPHQLDKAIAVLKSLTAPHETSKFNSEHAWRKCRRCLSIELLEDDEVNECLIALIKDYERYRACPHTTLRISWQGDRRVLRCAACGVDRGSD